MNASDHVVNFGKHDGRTLGEILERDAAYLNWMLEECEFLTRPHNAALYAAVVEMCEENEDAIEDALRMRRAER